MSEFFQLEWGALLTGSAAVFATIKLSRAARRREAQKQLQDWRMPLYQELASNLGKVDETVSTVLSSLMLPNDFRDERGIKISQRERDKINKQRDKAGADAWDALSKSRSEIAGAKIRIQTIGTVELDQSIEDLLKILSGTETVFNRDKVYSILANSWYFEIRAATREVVRIMRKTMEFADKNSPFDFTDSSYAAFEEISKEVSRVLSDEKLTVQEKKRLLSGEILKINNYYYAWFKVDGLPGKLAKSSLNEKIERNEFSRWNRIAKGNI